jgi:hypothetical protein
MTSVGQGRKYSNHVKIYNRKNNNSDMDIERIKEWMTNNRIDCVKYNYSLEEEVQNFSTFDGQIQLSDDAKFLYIFNRKPVANDLYVDERDPEELQRVKMVEKIIDLEEEKHVIINKEFNYHKVKKEIEKLTRGMDLSELAKYMTQ